MPNSQLKRTVYIVNDSNAINSLKEPKVITRHHVLVGNFHLNFSKVVGHPGFVT